MIRNLIIIAMLATAAPVFAAADPATVAAATALVQQLNVKGEITAGMNQVIANMRSGASMKQMLSQQPGFEQSRAAQPAKFDQVLKRIGGMQADAAQKVVTTQIPAVVDAATQAYARSYSASELKGLAEFYRTPLGMAMLARQPGISAEVNQATQQLIGTRIQAAMQALGPQMDAELRTLQPAAPPKK